MLTTTKGSEQRAYTYNGDGTLVAQTANGVQTRFTQDLVSPLSQILQTTQGTTTKSYVYGHERLYEQAGIVKTWLWWSKVSIVVSITSKTVTIQVAFIGSSCVKLRYSNQNLAQDCR